MKTLSVAALSGFVFASLAGCGPSEISRSTRWNVHDRIVSVDAGDPTNPEAAKVVRGAPFQVAVSISPKHSRDATEQDGEWVFYKDGRLFGRIDADDVDFSQAPTILALNAHSTSKRTGSYTYELYLDDELVAEIPVEVIPAPSFHPVIEH